MKIKEAKRVAKIKKTIPSDIVNKLGKRDEESTRKFHEFQKFAQNQDRLDRIKSALNEENGILIKSNNKRKMQDKNLISINGIADKQAADREATLIHGEGGAIIGSPNEPTVESNFLEENVFVGDQDDPYAAVMTDAHAEVALERDERREKRMKAEKLKQFEKVHSFEEKGKQERASLEEQLESERNFRKYLIANREKVIDAERHRNSSPFLRSGKKSKLRK